MIFSKRTNENPKKIKILWACSPRILDLHRILAGSERIERLRYLAKEGNDVYAIAANLEKGYYLRNSNLNLISIPIRYVPLISTIQYGLALFFLLPLYLVKIRPDFVISDPYTAPFLIWKPVLSKLLKFKMTLDIRGTPLNRGGVLAYVANICFNISVCMAKTMFDGMTIVTPMMRKEICQAFNINTKWVGILSNGVSDEFLAYERHARARLVQDRTELRRKFGLSNRFVILYHGSFRPNGGLLESIKAIALVKKDYPNVTLFLLGPAGRAPILPLLKTTIKENDVQDSVILHGPVDFYDVPGYISMCDLGIVPLPNTSDWRYQQPLKLLEYMAMKKTVIVSDSPAHRSLIGSNENGIYVSHVNPVELAKAMKYAYDNRDKLEEWGEIGREIVIRKYAWKKVNENLVNYLLEIQLGENRQK